MLKPGGYLAMFMTRSDESSPNENLGHEIDQVYEKYFHVKQKYNCKMNYENATNYGFSNLTYFEWKKQREFDVKEYISYISTHCEHITLEEPHKSNFYNGIREAFVKYGNKITIADAIPLYLVQKSS